MKRVIKASDQQFHKLLQQNAFSGMSYRPNHYQRKLQRGKKHPKYPRYHLIVTKLNKDIKMLDMHMDIEPHVNYVSDNLAILDMLQRFDHLIE